MFSTIFGSLLGEVVAPRPITNKEIFALLKVRNKVTACPLCIPPFEMVVVAIHSVWPD